MIWLIICLITAVKVESREASKLAEEKTGELHGIKEQLVKSEQQCQTLADKLKEMETSSKKLQEGVRSVNDSQSFF